MPPSLVPPSLVPPSFSCKVFEKTSVFVFVFSSSMVETLDSNTLGIDVVRKICFKSEVYSVFFEQWLTSLYVWMFC